MAKRIYIVKLDKFRNECSVYYSDYSIKKYSMSKLPKTVKLFINASNRKVEQLGENEEVYW